jgi:stress-induced-phosphoprotein 1
MTRHGNCLVRKGDLEAAVEVLNRALTEHRTPDALKLRDAAEKTLKQRKEDAYVDLEKADEAKNEGNDAFKGADYPRAVERYREALRRGPPGKWDEAYKVFSNRAACYTKLGALPDGAQSLPRCACRAALLV